MHLLERDLAAPVAGHLESLGYRVFAEVDIAGRWADLVGIGPDVIAVELKLRAWREALRQAMSYELGADRAFVALPLRGAQEAHRGRFAFEREGVGLLAVDPEDRVRTVIPAGPSPRRLPALTERLRADLQAFDAMAEVVASLVGYQ